MLKVIPAGEPDAGKAEVDFEEVPNQATQAFETMGADALAAMLQPALTGMRMSIFLKVNGELLETNSRFTSEKNPNVITVMDMPVDRMFSNAEAMKVLASQDPGAVHKLQDLDIPGVKLEAQDKIITLRFRE